MLLRLCFLPSPLEGALTSDVDGGLNFDSHRSFTLNPKHVKTQSYSSHSPVRTVAETGFKSLKRLSV